jgi:hypothetical protein
MRREGAAIQKGIASAAQLKKVDAQRALELRGGDPESFCRISSGRAGGDVSWGGIPSGRLSANRQTFGWLARDTSCFMRFTGGVRRGRPAARHNCRSGTKATHSVFRVAV